MVSFNNLLRRSGIGLASNCVGVECEGRGGGGGTSTILLSRYNFLAICYTRSNYDTRYFLMKDYQGNGEQRIQKNVDEAK